MQLDIFEHSRDVILRNAVIEALRRRDTAACSQAIASLVVEFAADPLLPAFILLSDRLHSPLHKPIERVDAMAILRETEGRVAAAAEQVFGATAPAWLAPLWAELATAIAHYPFDASQEELHAAPLLLRAGQWADAAALIEDIASWRRRPAPLAWMIEARGRLEGFDTLWPLLAELAWMDPQRAEALVAPLGSPLLDRLVRRFYCEFEGEGAADDFAWFPAWSLIADARLSDGLRLSRGGTNTAQERCARIVLGLLSLERQGRQAEIFEWRKKLRDAHPGLFARYMQDR
jgi:hypothetical protein